MTDFFSLLAEARERRDLSAVVAAVPYMAAMGMECHVDDEGVLGVMRFSEPLVGNFSIRALHGGTLGALLESTAALALLWREDVSVVPRIVNLTIEYLRNTGPVDTFARAEITTAGRRVARVRAVAWQDDPSRPVAAAQTCFLLG
ncbi:MAG: PaaI family thioesterase [Myxococcales bacterium]|nr:PaaI family thioesterase [Myxococcales bacterium]